jgi:hypothetical protein
MTFVTIRGVLFDNGGLIMKKSVILLLVVMLVISSHATPNAGMRFIQPGSEASKYKRFGRFELRMKLLAAPGCVSCFILVNDQSGSPESGSWQECDFEIVGDRTNLIETVAHVFRHSNMYPGRHRIVAFHEGTGEEFHTWAFEWTPDHFSWEIDRVPIRKAVLDNSGTIHDVVYSSVPPYDVVEEMVQSELNWIDVWSKDNMRCAFDVWQCDNPGWCGSWDAANNGSGAFFNYYRYYKYTPGKGPDGSDFTLEFEDNYDGPDFDLTAWEPYGCILKDGMAIGVLNGDTYTGQIPVDPGEPTAITQPVTRNAKKACFLEYRSGTVKYGVDFAGDANISVHDLNGRLIHNIVDSYHNQGIFEILINKKMAAGTYLLMLKTKRSAVVTRIISME